jgi:GNAT superfamily N-acetyltransferase
MPPIRLRLATEQDIPVIVDLWMRMMHEHEGFEERLELTRLAPAAYQSYLLMHSGKEKSHVAIAENDEGIQGFCCAYVSQNLPMFAPQQFGYVSDLFVVPALRGQGVGTSLVNHAREWFTSRGIRNMQLQVYTQNEKGLGFWKAKGFKPFFQRMWLDVEEQDAPE